MIVFTIEVGSNISRISQMILKYFSELKHLSGKIFLTISQNPPILEEISSLSDYKDSKETINSFSKKYSFITNKSHSLNPNDSFLLSHQKMGLILMEIFSLNNELNGDPYEEVSRFLYQPEIGIEIILSEKNMESQSIDSNSHLLNLEKKSLLHSVEDYKKIEIGFIQLKYIDYILKKFKSKEYNKINLKLKIDKIKIILEIIERIFKPRYSKMNLIKTNLRNFINKQPLNTNAIDYYCDSLVRKYYKQSIDYFLSDFEEFFESCLKEPFFTEEESTLGLWLRIQVLEYFLNFNENLKYQKKIIKNLKIIKGNCFFSQNIQSKIACLELQYLVHVRDIEQLLSLFNNIYFFESFEFDPVEAFEITEEVFKLEFHPVQINSILEKLLIITNYEISKCELSPHSKDSFWITFVLYCFTQVEVLHLSNFIVTLRTDSK